MKKERYTTGNEIIYFVGDSFLLCSNFSMLKCNGIWDASYLGEEANLKNTQSNSFSAKQFVLSIYMCDSHVHIPFLNYFCFRNSSENRGERDLRGSPRDCRYDMRSD